MKKDPTPWLQDARRLCKRSRAVRHVVETLIKDYERNMPIFKLEMLFVTCQVLETAFG
jgi:hypothetical protein